MNQLPSRTDTENMELVRRLAYWANHHDDPQAWKRMADEAGCTVTHTDRGFDIETMADGKHIGCVWWGRRTEEWFAFVWMPEAMPALRSKLWWRLTHPFAPLSPLPFRGEC